MTIEIDSNEFVIDNLGKQYVRLPGRRITATCGPTTDCLALWTGVMKYEVQYRL